MDTNQQRIIAKRKGLIRQPKRQLKGKQSSLINHKNTLRIHDPLAILLSQSIDDGDSRLLRIAQSTHTNTSDIHRLRAELIQKLKRLEYPQPVEGHANQHKKTFYQRLETTGALATLLQPS